MDSQLHLPGPHLCPVCNVVHRIGAESLPRNLAELLRPYYATYTPSKFVSATELYLQGTFASTAGTGYATSTYTSSHADTSVAATPASTSWTILKTGTFVITAIVGESAGNNESLQIEIVVNGSQVATGTASVQAALATLQAAAFWRGTVTAAQVVSVQVKSANSAAVSGSVLIEFVPTAANPQ